jgi:hypothetical protein
MKQLKSLLLLATLTLGGFSANAQEATSETESTLEISGFVDAYYQYNLNGSAAGTTSFTPAHNSFELGMANVVFKKELKKVGFVADLAFGPRAVAANGGEGAVNIIKQLFVTYAPTDKLIFTAGNFSTHVGYEYIDAPNNVNYSMSYMFSNGPFFHTGIKANYAFNENFGAMIGVFNDTDSKTDLGLAPGKHIGAQLSYTKDKAAIFLNYIGGKEDTTVTINQIDVTATYQVTEDFLVGLNATTKNYSIEGADGTAWSGAALYLNYSLSDKFALGFRGEYFDTTADLTYTAYTLSGNYKIGDLVIIPELRIDTASEEVFTDADGAAVGASPAFILGVYYAF